MSQQAAAYAQKLAQMGTLQHASSEERQGHGENLSMGCSTNKGGQTATEAVTNWYGTTKQLCKHDPFHSQVQNVLSYNLLREKYMSQVSRTFILCDAVFLMRLSLLGVKGLRKPGSFSQPLKEKCISEDSENW